MEKSYTDNSVTLVIWLEQAGKQKNQKLNSEVQCECTSYYVYVCTSAFKRLEDIQCMCSECSKHLHQELKMANGCIMVLWIKSVVNVMMKIFWD